MARASADAGHPPPSARRRAIPAHLVLPSARFYHDPVDRLDSWLNDQVGWRRLAINWLILCPVAVALGSSTSSEISLRHPGCEQLAGQRFIQECEPRLGTGFLVVVVVSVLAAVPLAGLLAVWQRRRAARNPRRPFHSWSKIAAIWCLSTAPLLTTFADQQPYGRRTYYFVAGWVLIAGAVVFWLIETRRHQRLSRGNAPGVQGQ